MLLVDTGGGQVLLRLMLDLLQNERSLASLIHTLGATTVPKIVTLVMNRCMVLHSCWVPIHIVSIVELN